MVTLPPPFIVLPSTAPTIALGATRPPSIASPSAAPTTTPLPLQLGTSVGSLAIEASTATRPLSLTISRRSDMGRSSSRLIQRDLNDVIAFYCDEFRNCRRFGIGIFDSIPWCFKGGEHKLAPSTVTNYASRGPRVRDRIGPRGDVE
ncbi:conserved hypothetical protein [Ricinus communis]|uniref:Uncharacterized protein n=1 Tax=Ricinus communis TaxID=3988 RepID=B9S3J6_RICCO|nr:conserved hypothetical protein [Ricinus communis]